MARWRTQSDADAEDLVQNTLVRVLDPDDAPWVKYTFLAHMNFYMRQVWDQLMRKASAQREVLARGIAADGNTVDPRPSQDDELHRLRTFDVWRSLIPGILDELDEKHALVRKIYVAAARGIDKPADQAREVGCDVEEVHLALKTFEYHAKLALKRWHLAERRRMQDLRDTHARKKEEANP
jgi:DNA-directed RNA polymerase specialized sigma24 family protein